MSLHFEDFISLACFGLSLLAVFRSVSALSIRRPGCYPQLSFLSSRDKHMTVYEQFILKGVRADDKRQDVSINDILENEVLGWAEKQLP